jgi:hypothetical protein
VNKIIASVAITVSLLVTAAAQAQQRSTASRPGSNLRQAQVTNRARTTTAPTQSRSNQPTPPRSAVVKPASHQTIVSDGIIYEDGGMGFEGDYIADGGCQSCDGGGCGSCTGGSCGIVGGGSCNTCSAPGQFCICFPAHGWVHAEYLNWYQDGMGVPPLVTTSNPSTTARANAGVLGRATTSVLFGDDDILDGSRDGFRIRFGWWLAAWPLWGIEGEYVGLGQETESFFRQSTGTPILARPFFNALTGAEDSELVAFPSVIGGSIAVDATSQLDGAAVRLRRQLCCSDGCGYSFLACQTVPTSSRLDGTIGYRFWDLTESLQMQERLTSQITADPGSFVITDRFDTQNLFNGAELGVLWQGRRGWWSLDMLMRLGIGNMHQTVTIGGTTATTINGTTTNSTGGLLAQRTNIGTYDQNRFTMVPELGATVGYQMTRRLRATFGYSMVYIGNVVRPGDQVDLDVNPNLLPPENVPFTGPLRPQFDFVETDYWVQGLSFGGEFRW